MPEQPSLVIGKEDFNILCRVVESLAMMIREREMRHETTQLQAPNHGHVGVDTNNIEKFKRLKPPIFRGCSDTLMAEDWIKKIEKLFGVIEVNVEQKI